LKGFGETFSKVSPKKDFKLRRIDMNENEVTTNEPTEVNEKCAHCTELEIAVGVMGLILLIMPVVFVIVGCFIGKKLASK
jgi:hypothetical protein